MVIFGLCRCGVVRYGCQREVGRQILAEEFKRSPLCVRLGRLLVAALCFSEALAAEVSNKKPAEAGQCLLQEAINCVCAC